MAQRPRNSALSAIQKGVTIKGEDGKPIKETPAESAEKARLVGADNQSGPGNGNGPASGPTGGPSSGPTGGPSSGPAKPSASGVKSVSDLGGKSAADFATSDKPRFGVHPKNGEQVEIDWSAEGASPSAPFGLLADGSPRIRRKSKRNRGNVKDTKKLVQAKGDDGVTFLAKGIFILHASLASRPGQEHWAQSMDEATAYADAIQQLQEVYGVTVDPKTAAWANLAMVVGGGTVPRVMASMSSRRKPKQEPQSEAKAPPNLRAVTPVQPAPKQPPKGAPKTPSELFEKAGATPNDFSGADPTGE